MFSHLVVVLALSLFSPSVAYEDGSQKILSHVEEYPNFIASSIFGRKSNNILNLQMPEVAPPTYKPRDSEDTFQGLGTFAHLDFTQCTEPESNATFDIGIVGHPFDLGVSYRPGARFGTNGARQGARRMSPAAGWE